MARFVRVRGANRPKGAPLSLRPFAPSPLDVTTWPPIIRVEGISHGYQDAIALRDIGFEVAPGEKVVLLGVNGSGKSTLLRLLDGLIAPSSGRYFFRDEEVTSRALKARAFNRRFRQAVVLLFQNPDAMLFNPTVYDEIAFGPRQLALADVDERVRHWAELLGVAAHLARPPFGLSGGEKQKVCLAALLAVEPQLLLLDEPTAALDPRTTGWLVDFLSDLPLTVITSTHNLSLAGELGGRALVIGEDHGLFYDGPVEPFLADTASLVAANLAHTHRHRHGGVMHRHFHVHDWE